MEFIFIILILALTSQPAPEEFYWICEEPLRLEDGYLVCTLEQVPSSTPPQK